MFSSSFSLDEKEAKNQAAAKPTHNPAPAHKGKCSRVLENSFH